MELLRCGKNYYLSIIFFVKQKTAYELRISDGSSDVCSSDLSALRLNTGISGLERADVILLAGTNLRWEAPLLNTRVRKAIRHGKAKVFAIGPEVDLTYKATCLGNDLGLLASQIGRAHVCTPVPNAHLVSRLLLEKKK